MDSLNTPPPIPAPDGHVWPRQPVTLPAVQRGDWQNAPKIVKGWAYPLTWLAMIGLAVFLIVCVCNEMPAANKIAGVLFLVALMALVLWLNNALRKGVPVAWTVQIILSIIGLASFPLGTLIHGYILSQWFTPENKAWFGRS